MLFPLGKKWWLCEMTKVFHNVCSCSVAQSCLTLWDPMNCSTPGFPVLHYLQEFAQTHVDWVSDAIQPSYPLSPPSPPALNLFPRQGLFQWLGSSHQGAKVTGVSASSSVLPMNIQSWFLWRPTGLISLLFTWHSRVFSSNTVQRHQFFGAQLSLLSHSHNHWEDHNMYM